VVASPAMALGPVRCPVRGVIFDMDGLLVDTGPAWRRVGNRLFADLGIDISAVAASGAVAGLSLHDAMDLFRSYAGLGQVDHADLEQQMETRMVAAVSSGVELKPGALEALDFCRRHGLPTALASGSSPALIDAVLEQVGLVGRFGAVCSATEVPLGKPHPALFLRAAAMLDVPAQACLVLEDAIDGCIAAKAARMRVAAVPDSREVPDPRFAIADIVLTSLLELSSEEALSSLGVVLAQ
jgi:HAD superfamily hydrolase (TIGR01509 family)